MAPKREPSIKKSPSGGTLPRLGPPFPCSASISSSPKPVPELKPRLLRPSDSPFDPSTLEVCNDPAILSLKYLLFFFFSLDYISMCSHLNSVLN